MGENTSGHGKFAVVPDEVRKWNWGAFWLTWIWGIGNGSYIALLALLPILNLIMPFYLGKNGNELAWRNNSWYDLEDLHGTQKKWALAGWIIGLFFIIIIIANQVTKYQDAKESQETSIKIMGIVMEDIEAKKLIGEDYEIVHNMPYSIDMSMDNLFGYDMTLSANDEFYSVYAKIGEDKEIKSVKVSEWGDDGKTKNEILIEVDN